MQFSFAQSIVVTGGDYFTSDMMTDITHHLDLKNNSSNTITVVCQKTIISMPNNLPVWGGASYCFAGNCYSASSTLPSTPAVLSPGQEITYSNNDLEAFSGYYVPAQVAGISVVEYCFYDENNPSDETCVTVTYNISSTTGVNDIDRISQFYPNPANENIYFEYYLDKSANFVVMDILGNQVKQLQILDAGKQTVNISDLSQGIYFGSIISDDKIKNTQKIIVK
tara:strand:- start:646 stop:1317 length:672 start_codon:yes stop_codon:yes gene_type:complete